MPHQCLKCGTLFAEGTTTILRGCPDCRGTRFFFTQEPLTLSERERLLQQTERDLPVLAERLARPHPPPPPEPGPSPGHDPLPVPQAFAPTPRGEGEVLPDGRLLVKLPRNVQQRLRRATSGWDYEVPQVATPIQPRKVAGPIETDADPVITEIPRLGAAAPPPEETGLGPAPEAPRAEQALPPETVRIPAVGQYEIDVRRLLEKSPIVIQRDGSYLIHLPSLFEGAKKKQGPVD